MKVLAVQATWEQEDYYQFLNTLDMMAQSYEPDGTPFGRNYILYAYFANISQLHFLPLTHA
ncbi:hypothetical protein [uncultured Prevotella sp.]|uniref:hypothetical protein n=1 Tax=uncultured Prevotella sp. TaxID=159272 RepID=UPI0025D2A6B6|nr:hypothetical protein [uncultured Prevotella sp.]